MDINAPTEQSFFQPKLWRSLMRFASSLIIITLFIVSLFAGCAKPSASDMMADADKAFRADKDYAKAQTLYRMVLDWKGDGGPSDAQRFEASFNGVRCLVKQKNYDDAVKSLEEMQKIYAGTMNYKNLCTVIGDLSQERAIE
ncbi:MAG: tetratricopeptide repeat protein, partial [Planctomycetota bacterium]